MDGILLQLGEIQFTIEKRSFEELASGTSYRWPRLDRLGRRPAHQWIGIGEDEKTIEGTVYPLLQPSGGPKVVGIKQIEEMRAIAEEGNPLQLTDGMGNNYGKWVILRIEERASDHLSNGAPRKQKFTMQISRYGEDNLGEAGILWAGGDFNTPHVGTGTGMGGPGEIGLGTGGSLA